MDEFAAAATRPVPRFGWNLKQAGMIPIIVGPGTLQMHLYATSTAAQGYGEYAWIEFETPRLVQK